MCGLCQPDCMKLSIVEIRFWFSEPNLEQILGYALSLVLLCSELSLWKTSSILPVPAGLRI